MSFYEDMENLEQLPNKASEGDLCKYKGQPYVYVQNEWISLHESARRIILEQREKL